MSDVSLGLYWSNCGKRPVAKLAKKTNSLVRKHIHGDAGEIYRTNLLLDAVCRVIVFTFINILYCTAYLYLQCFDAVGWAAGRASGL